MIQLKDIQFRYPQSDFKLEIDFLGFEEGTKTAIIGPSGFGKTTTLNLLAGILIPEEGKISISNEVINKLSETQRRNFRIQNIGFIFQDFRLVPYLNVLDNILLPFQINTILKPRKNSEFLAKELAGDLGIGKLIRKYPAKLSHGERQRVAIARALVNEPKILLADEPTGNLDPENKIHIKNILFKAVEKFGTTLITVTHDHEMLSGFDKVVDFKNYRTKTKS
jgi:putative ABC transport system ATP-binding protein